MTVIQNMDMKCGLCGETSQQPVLFSTNSMGYGDLDLRPPAMQRDTMNTWVLECPHCGYVACNLEDKPTIDRKFVESESYTTCDGNEFKSNLSRIFYRDYLIAKDGDNLYKEFFSIIYCTWACDDIEDPLAEDMRRLALKLVDRILEAEYDENSYLIKADLLRRSRQFERLSEEYENFSSQNELINNIIRFQIEKANQKDDACYTVKDVIDEYGSQ